MAEQEEAPPADDATAEEQQQEDAPKEEKEAPAEFDFTVDAKPEEEPEEEPKAEQEEPKEEEPKEEESKEEEPKDEQPKQEEPKQEEPKQEEPKQKATEEEEVKEEPKKKKSKKKKSSRKKKKSSNSGGGSDEADSLWKQLSAKKSDINWYITKINGKIGKTTQLTLVQSGNGGAIEIVNFLKDKESSVLFGLLKCITTDDSKSVRTKFIYLRFVGSKVKSITKAKLTTNIGKIDDQFPCKHLTMDIDEKAAGDLSPNKMAKELLRVGGAHKPDKMSFGPDQDVQMKDL